MLPVYQEKRVQQLCVLCMALKLVYKNEMASYVNLRYLVIIYRVGQKRSLYQTVQYFIQSKTDNLYVTIFEYSLHSFSVTILR